MLEFATALAQFRREFADYLTALKVGVLHLAKVLEFECAALATLLDQQPRTVVFESDPLPVLRALAEGRLPETPARQGRFEIELTPDGPVSVAGLDTGIIRQVFPFH